jgi:hypothetical protein
LTHSPWFQPLSLKCDLLVSSLCFHMGQLVPLHYVDYVRVYRHKVKEVQSEVWWFLSLAVGGGVHVEFS